jgi:NADH-quinone oxidoreductase subunit M
MENINSLTVLLSVPFFCAILAWFIPKGLQRLYAIFASLAIFALTLYESASVIFTTSASQASGLALEQKLSWIPELGLSLHLRLDSVSVWFVVLNALVAVIAFSLRGPWYRKQPRLFTSLGFFLVFALNSAFLSQDLILFYLSYEAVYIPMIFMVGIWGQHTKATSVFRFFLMSFTGSILMLASMLYLIFLYHSQTGEYSSSLIDLLQVTAGKSPESLRWCFLGFFLAFSIKVPLFPFHGWLKEVYVNAPMPATIWLSAILSKLGIFGFIRFVAPLFGEVAQLYQGILLALAAISILYAAMMAIRSNQPKSLLAYSSISHLGFVMLGIFALNPGGYSSAILLSVGHTIVSAMLFYVLHLIEERREGLGLETTHGLAKSYPTLFFAFFVAVLAAVSLPGTLNFVGEFLVMLHAYPSSAFCTIAASFGVVFGAVYMLKFYQQLGLGKESPAPVGIVPSSALKDLGGYDLLILLSLIVILIYFGFQPDIFLKGN